MHENDVKSLFTINGKNNSRTTKIILGVIPFILIIGIYSVTSVIRHIDNPDDRMVPSITQLAEGIKSTFKYQDEDNPSFMTLRVVRDFKASIRLIFTATMISIVLSVLIGLYSGSFPFFEKVNMPIIRSLSFIPPIALLPLFFVWFSKDLELAKYAVVIAGTYFVLVSDIFMKINQVPKKLIDKAYTLGASTNEVLYKVVLRFSLPGIIESIRLTITPAWIFTIAAEFSFPSTEGLGYYMNVVRRQLGVNVILWYIFIIIIIGIITDLFLRLLNNRINKWYFDKGLKNA